MHHLSSVAILTLATSVSATTRSRRGYNDGIHLAVGPQCGSLPGAAADMNAGLNINQYKTIVSFGVRPFSELIRLVLSLFQDSYTDGGRQDGGSLVPAVIIPPNAQAGGRSTNGPVWVEDIVSDIGAHLMDYAVSFATPSPNRFLMPDLRY